MPSRAPVSVGAGLLEFFSVGKVQAVAVRHAAAAVREALEQSPTLYDYAAAHPDRLTLAGRAVAYAVPLPHTGWRAVVRHNRHGGLLARLTGDRFVPPTRAPHELEMSLWLRAAAVPTPEFIGYARYPAGPGFERSDVLTREIPHSHDLAHVLTQDGATEREAALAASAALVAQLSAAGARHHDLNAKNILLTFEGGVQAYVLDVDRVVLGQKPAKALAANLGRLARSLRKWRDQFNARISEAEIKDLQRTTKALVTG